MASKRPVTVHYSKWDTIDCSSDSESDDNHVVDGQINEFTARQKIGNNQTALEHLCESDSLSLHALEEIIKHIPPGEHRKLSLTEEAFWYACNNKRVTLDIITLLLEVVLERPVAKLASSVLLQKHRHILSTRHATMKIARAQ